MAKIKSTVDLIMEKTKHLSLNAEEKAALAEKQLSQRVRAAVVRYLKGEINADYLAQELGQLPPESMEEGKRLCLRLLMDSLSPLADNQRIFDAAGRLLGDRARERWEKKVAPLAGQVCDDLEEAREKALDRCREALAAAGLRGPALLPRLDEEDPSWMEEQEQRIKAFRASVKKALNDSQR